MGGIRGNVEQRVTQAAVTFVRTRDWEQAAKAAGVSVATAKAYRNTQATRWLLAVELAEEETWGNAATKALRALVATVEEATDNNQRTNAAAQIIRGQTDRQRIIADARRHRQVNLSMDEFGRYLDRLRAVIQEVVPQDFWHELESRMAAVAVRDDDGA